MSNLSNKKSFQLYHDLCSVFEELTDEQAGQLIKEIIKYSVSRTQPNPTEPTGLNGLLKVLFIPFKIHIDRDLQAYLAMVEKNRNNGKNGGRKSKQKTQPNPSEPDKDKDKDKDKDIKKNKEKEISEIKKAFFLPNFIDEKLWEDFLQMRIKKKKPATQKAQELILKKLSRFHQEGKDTSEILQQSIIKCYEDVYPISNKGVSHDRVRNSAEQLFAKYSD